MNLIGFCGAHCTGKTTLAQTLAQKTQVHFAKTNASEIFQQLNLDCNQDLNHEKLILSQTKIIESFSQIWQKNSNGFTDRTPFDVLAYFYFKREKGALKAEEIKLIHQCYAGLKFFRQIFFIDEGIPFQERQGTENKGNKESVNYISELLIQIIENRFAFCRYNVQIPIISIPKNLIDAEKRIQFVQTYLN